MKKSVLTNGVLRRIATGVAATVALSAGAVVVASTPSYAAIPCDEYIQSTGGTPDNPTPWWGGQTGTVYGDLYVHQKPYGTTTEQWTKFQCHNDQDPTADYWGITVETTWQFTGGNQGDPATMFQQIYSDTPALGGIKAATDSWTSSTNCSTPVAVGLNFYIFSIGGVMQACNSYGITRYNEDDNGAQWTSSNAGELRDINTTFVERVPQGVIPRFDVQFGIPQYVGVPDPCQCPYYDVSSHLVWTDISDAGSSLVGGVSTGGSGGTGSTAGGGPAQFGDGRMAFQANTTNLWTYGSSIGSTDSHLGMAPGTSPAIAHMADGSYVTAFQANTSHLFIADSAGVHDTGLGMAAGTSPAIASTSGGGWVVAFQANSSRLWTFNSAGAAHDTGLGMAAGTSPAITGVAGGGWAAAFQANTTRLWTWDSAGAAHDTGLGMAAGTSPAITGISGGGWAAAFQANTTNLWTLNSAGAGHDTGLGMAAGTSPAITGLSGGGWAAAFQANTTRLWTFNSAGAGHDTGLGMAAGTTPAITGLSGGGWAAAFQANTTRLWTFNSAGAGHDTGLGMAAGTSPGIEH